MEEWIKKSEVLELLSLPSDILAEYIYELKGVWVDEDWNKWIPCSERLPETDKNRKYLVCGEKSGIYISEFVCNTVDGTPLGMSWWTAKGRYCPNPIAWMSLPEPYKEKIGGKNI